MATTDPKQIRRFLTDCRLRRHGWARFQDGTRRAALRMMTTPFQGESVARYEVRTIDADPTAGDIDFHKAPPVPVYYVHDTETDQPVPLSSSHDREAVDQQCARLNASA
ncbi:hypothetical protein ACF1GW_35635 [Streptomyces achromogenes]|uniref:hypothetical protein n=1 Tax=Streptomyces achromogenes TaxID=67255 RepID=UPI0036FDD2F7